MPSSLERDHHMDGWSFRAKPCTRPESNSLQSQEKSPSDETINRFTHTRWPYTHVKDHVVHVRVHGLWKHYNNPASTENVRVFKVLKLDTVQRKKSIILYSYQSQFCLESARRSSLKGRERVVTVSQTNNGIVDHFTTAFIRTVIFMRIVMRQTREPVWPSSKALDWQAERPLFKSASAILFLQKLWPLDTVLFVTLFLTVNETLK